MGVSTDEQFHPFNGKLKVMPTLENEERILGAWTHERNREGWVQTKVDSRINQLVASPFYFYIWVHRSNSRIIDQALNQPSWEPRVHCTIPVDEVATGMKRCSDNYRDNAEYFKSTWIKEAIVSNKMKLHGRGLLCPQDKLRIAQDEARDVLLDYQNNESYSASHYSRIRQLIPLPADAVGWIYDLYHSGKLFPRLVADCIAKARSWGDMCDRLHTCLASHQREVDQQHWNARAFMLEYCDGFERWEQAFGWRPPCPLLSFSPFGFSFKAFRPILEAIEPETLKSLLAEGWNEEWDDPQYGKSRLWIHVVQRREELFQTAFKLTVAFGSLAAVKSVLRKRNESTAQAFHDLAQFQLPNRGKWTIGVWRNLLMHHAGRGREFLHLAPRIEKMLGRPPKTIEEAEKAAGHVAYKRARENPELARLCLEHYVSEEQFEAYLDLMRRAKKRDTCPDLVFDIIVGDKSLIFRRLKPGDPTGPLLGLMTNCCQHLHGAARGCAVAGVVDEKASFYVVQRGNKIIAQCFAWRHQDTLVFDSWEPIGPAYVGACLPVLTKAGELALQIDQELNKVCLGVGGRTPELSLPIADPPVSKPRNLTYSDAVKQYTVAVR